MVRISCSALSMFAPSQRQWLHDESLIFPKSDTVEVSHVDGLEKEVYCKAVE